MVANFNPHPPMITRAVQHTFTPEELASAGQAAALLQELFGFCTALEPRDRHDLYKLGPQTLSFVMRIVPLAQQHLDLIPRGMDVDELEARIKTRETLQTYVMHLGPLLLRMQHSIMLLGAEILQDSLKLYKTLKVNGNDEGLQELLAKIGQRFYTKKEKRKAAATEVPEETAPKQGTIPENELQPAPGSFTSTTEPGQTHQAPDFCKSTAPLSGKPKRRAPGSATLKKRHVAESNASAWDPASAILEALSNVCPGKADKRAPRCVDASEPTDG